ncbi:MAG: hypothetical protein L0Z70_02425 [Chloroflexi bacterium]|nr:hypothetical protein [Chloroflexota bacterium]
MQLSEVIGKMPYRLALAGGWIDQPFISRFNPSPPGAMAVVSIEPDYRFMDRCGMGTSTRKVAQRLWGDSLPRGDPATLMRQLYQTENQGKAEPSGSQDMAGLVYPGVSRLDYDAAYQGGVFPVHVETHSGAQCAAWLERILHILPVAPRPEGYNPLGVKNLAAQWVRRLGQSGMDCYAAILNQDARALGESMNECMRCWEALLPHTVRHPTLSVDLMGLLAVYQARSLGAMYSGCGGGYLLIVSDEPVPGAFQARVRVANG